MMFTSIKTPFTRAQFEECMNYAAEHMRMGKTHFAKGLRGPESLLNVRYLPNRRIDLLSIDEMARLHGNMLYQMRDEQFLNGPVDDTEG